MAKTQLRRAWRPTFGSDTTLYGKAPSCDAILSQTKLLERSASGNLDLSSDDIDTGDLLSNCVLDLTIQ